MNIRTQTRPLGASSKTYVTLDPTSSQVDPLVINNRTEWTVLYENEIEGAPS